MADFSVVSHNIHGLNNSESYLRSLLERNDIVLIQEHWQFSRNFKRMSSLSPLHEMIATDGMKNRETEGLMLGRPYGGTACFWSRKISPFVTPVLGISNPRLSALRIDYRDCSLILFNVYMPYLDVRNKTESINDFIDVLSCIEMIHDDNSDCELIIAGDLNFQPGTGSPYESLFAEFCSTLGLLFCDNMFDNSGIDFTFFNEPRNVYRWLDHFCVSTTSLVSDISNLVIVNDATNLSDHLPIACNVHVSFPESSAMLNNSNNSHSRIMWEKCTDEHLNEYHKRLDHFLDNIIPPNVVSCTDVHCTNGQHQRELEVLHGLTWAVFNQPTRFCQEVVQE